MTMTAVEPTVAATGPSSARPLHCVCEDCRQVGLCGTAPSRPADLVSLTTDEAEERGACVVCVDLVRQFVDNCPGCAA